MRNLSLSLLLLTLVGCGGDSNVGSPCDKDEQCGGDLICDFHDGKGTCQAPHDHVSAGETHHESTGGSSTASTSDDPTAATTGSTTHGHDTDGHGTSTTGATDELCASYCTCLEANCSGHDHFPHADVAACEVACAGFGEAERSCWIPYCELAAKGDSAQVHYCEHASGSLGLEECG